MKLVVDCRFDRETRQWIGTGKEPVNGVEIVMEAPTYDELAAKIASRLAELREGIEPIELTFNLPKFT